MIMKALKSFLLFKTNSLRFKISIVYVAVIGLFLILIQAGLYFNYVQSVLHQFDSQLQNKAEQIGGAVNTFRGEMVRQKHPFYLAAKKALNLNIEYPKYIFMPVSMEKFWLADAKKLGLGKDYILIMDTNGNVIAKSKNVSKGFVSYFKQAGHLRLDKDIFYKMNFNGKFLRIAAVPYFYAYQQGYVIFVGASYGPVQQLLWEHLLFVLISTLGFLFLASLIIRLFVIKILSAVLHISNVARNISQENLSGRIHITHADEEIEHLTESLNGMVSRLENSFNHIKEFSLEVAHEIKTPLAIISGNSQMALGKECTTEEYKETLGIVLHEAKRTQQFVSDLLLLTRLDYRLVQLRFEAIDLGAFLSAIGEEMKALAAAKGVEIQVDVSHEPVFLRGDKVHLERVFLNLIDNALKFTSDKGRIRITLRKNDVRSLVQISDTGSGISEEDLPKIFNKFYHVDKNQRDSIPGCGLGLSIAYSIVEAHQGKITVQSKLGQGTTFQLEFPALNLKEEGGPVKAHVSAMTQANS
ncbi:MAG: ATP-binding protein [Candidatus Omnitrophica bacterium]|nr:ATP-binding protein [Candidatus Omnitrophota bacterium]